MRLQKIIATFSQPSFSDAERLTFLKAILTEDNEKAQEMVEENPKIIEARSKTTGYSALHIAAERGHTAVFEILIARGLDPNEQTTKKKTPGSLAKEFKRLEIMAILERLKTNPFDKVGAFSFKGYGKPIAGIQHYQLHGGLHEHLRTIFSKSQFAIVGTEHGEPLSLHVIDAIIELSINGGGFIVGLEGTPRVRAAEISTVGEDRGVDTTNGGQCLYGLEDETLFSLTYLRSLKMHSDMQRHGDTSQIDRFDYLLKNHTRSVARELCRQGSPIKEAFDTIVETLPYSIKTFITEAAKIGEEMVTKILLQFTPAKRNQLTEPLFVSILKGATIFTNTQKKELKRMCDEAMVPSTLEEFNQKYALEQRTQIWVKNILAITKNRTENMVILCGYKHQPILEKMLLARQASNLPCKEGA